LSDSLLNLNLSIFMEPSILEALDTMLDNYMLMSRTILTPRCLWCSTKLICTLSKNNCGLIIFKEKKKTLLRLLPDWNWLTTA
jgi:hypothetical protein